MRIMSNLLSSHSDLFELKKNLTIYDQDFCPLMREHPYMNNLKKETYERYRDLQKVWENEICKKAGFNKTNTLLIDSDDTKVQLYIENSITNKSYTLEDV